MPLPLAMMIPFMGIQSAVMAKQFGENFQYGKRRISAMSNEEFNKLTPKMIQDNANAELKAMIPSMEQSVIEMREFQKFLIGEFLKMVKDLVAAGFGKLFEVDEGSLADNIEHYMHGHGWNKPHDGKTQSPPSADNPITPQPDFTPPVVKDKNLKKRVKFQSVVLKSGCPYEQINVMWSFNDVTNFRNHMLKMELSYKSGTCWIRANGTRKHLDNIIQTWWSRPVG